VRTHRDLGYEVPVLVLEVVVGGVRDHRGNAWVEKDAGARSLAFVVRGGVERLAPLHRALLRDRYTGIPLVRRQ
jgi:hypothetical protein